MYRLYYSPGSASMAVHWALLEIGAPYQLELVNFDDKAQKSAAYLALNPDGRVPTLVIGDRPYVESAALLMTLAERHPAAGLAPPAGTAAHAEWYQSLVYQSTVLGATYRAWFYPLDLGVPEHSAATRGALAARIESVWTRLDMQLAGGGPYLLGAQATAADLLLVMYLRWSRNMPRSALEWPALKEYANRMRARPSWLRLCELEGLTEWRGPS